VPSLGKGIALKMRSKTLIMVAVLAIIGAGILLRLEEGPAFAGSPGPEIAVAKGPGNSPLVRTFLSDGSPTTPFANPTLVYQQSFKGGSYVALGDVNGSGSVQEVITGAQAGGGSHVRIFGQFGEEIFSFFAFPDGFSGGARVASGYINGDGNADVIVGAGPGGGPHVRVFDGAALEAGTLSEIYSIFAYPSGFSGGVFVASADFDGDGLDDIITGAGEGGGPHVRVFSGADGSPLAGFFPFQSGFGGGVRVAGGDINGDNKDDVIVGAGPSGGPHVRVMDATNPNNSLLDIFPYAAGFTGGVFVGSYDVGCPNGSPDGTAEILTGAGSGGGPHVRGFDATGTPILGFFPYEGEFSGGVKVGGAWSVCNHGI
jgi:hypothetical protein